MDVLMNLTVVVPVLLVAAVPMYAHAQNLRVIQGDRTEGRVDYQWRQSQITNLLRYDETR
jgi:hypothetical protein